MELLQIPSFPILLSLFVFTLMVVRIWKKHNKELSAPPPPGPWKLPVLGNIHQLVGARAHHRLRDLAKVYGPLMSIQIGQISGVVVSSAEMAKETLKTHGEQFAGKRLLYAAKVVMYNGFGILFSPYGDHWRQMRKISTLEMLSAKRVQSFRSVREEEVSNVIKFLHSNAGSPVNLTNTLFNLTNSIIQISSFGKNCKHQEDTSRLLRGVTQALEGFNVIDMFPSLKFLHYFSVYKYRLERFREEVDQLIEDIMKEQKTRKSAGDSHNHQAEPQSLLDVLLDIQENGDLEIPLTNDVIKAVMLDIVGAGSDSTTKAAVWTMAELMSNPKAMKKAQEEVRRVFGEMRKVDESRLQDLKFLKLVIKESLRLHPSGSAFVTRECRGKTRIHGYDINPKTELIVNLWAIGRDPNYWIEAEKFWPERFEESSIDFKGTNFELIPFGAGKRICPGLTFGTTTLEVLLANLLFHFDWKLPDGVDTLDMAEDFSAVLRKNTDLNLIPIPFFPLPTN